jgi:hypothetical protein
MMPERPEAHKALPLADRSRLDLTVRSDPGRSAEKYPGVHLVAIAIAIRAAIDAVPPRLARDPGFDLAHYAENRAAPAKPVHIT